jgi:EAL domain-containing protein (putative c-di-GMP-specific phosphodiesterase class I)
MKQPAPPLGIAAIMAVAISVASAAGAYASGKRLELALALAAVVLASAHLVIFLYRDLHYRRRLAAMGELNARGRRLASELAALSRRVGALEFRRDQSSQSARQAKDLNREFEELRRSVKRLAEEYERVSVRDEPRRERESAGPRIMREPPQATHRLEFYLEPIVSLADNTTVHYRASLVLEGQGQRVAFEELVRQAAANGLRPDIDAYAVSRALAVAPRLAVRHPGTCVLVPVGAETLASRKTLAAIADQMERADAAGAAIVFEIDHATMATLDAQGIEGLAGLARDGAGMALSKAHGTGIDLAAMADLHFRFICFTAAALPVDGDMVPSWAPIARVAGEYGLTIAIQGLVYGEQVDVASRWAELGSGPAFAAPRRVREESQPSSRMRSAA